MAIPPASIGGTFFQGRASIKNPIFYTFTDEKTYSGLYPG